MPTITTPARVLAPLPPLTVSVASLKALLNKAFTVSPAFASAGSLTEVDWSSLIAASVTVVVVRVGASLTAVTDVSMLTVALDQPVLPPLIDTSL